MRIMTFNIRFENDIDGTNAWVRRRGHVVETIERYRPDIIGTQEGRWNQLRYLGDHLPAYLPVTSGRVLDATCQYPTLFIRKERFNVREGRDAWLSRTPEIHRSKAWDSAFPRMISYAHVVSRRTGMRLWVAVTHLDHMGVVARPQQAGIIAACIKNREGPVILMGDFNDVPGSGVHRLLTSPETGLVDTWQAADRGEGPRSATHHGFTGIPRNGRIDWILVSRHFRVEDARIIRDRFDGKYPSDHFPYQADLRRATPGQKNDGIRG
ncbi:MAG: endonuclease [Deltaproteobacteria bacterium]|nr:MAG: endonuclease [Deltaproteobacteria bacterium]